VRVFLNISCIIVGVGGLCGVGIDWEEEKEDRYASNAR
jgi:hypothetical protein